MEFDLCQDLLNCRINKVSESNHPGFRKASYTSQVSNIDSWRKGGMRKGEARGDGNVEWKLDPHACGNYWVLYDIRINIHVLNTTVCLLNVIGRSDMANSMT